MVPRDEGITGMALAGRRSDGDGDAEMTDEDIHELDLP